MPEYIDREAFVKEQRHLYCENCARRKGMKNGKMRFVYEIGDAPCRACGYGDVLDDLEDFPAADVRPVVRGKWKPVIAHFSHGRNEHAWEEAYAPEYTCSECGFELIAYGEKNFCPNCGAMMEES